ncbi:MAG: putative flippase GtrA [Bacteroidia bacterium]|jgi:putative flippase GtrA
MAIYQTSKEITKFTISGLIAVFVDFAVYYGLSNMVTNANDIVGGGLYWNDIYKGSGFIVGTLVSYNMNKFWTWRTSDKDNKRLLNFGVLYLISLIINIFINKWGLSTFQDNEIALLYTNHRGVAMALAPFKTDKLFAFILATGVCSIFTFLGQKIWVFKSAQSIEKDAPE